MVDTNEEQLLNELLRQLAREDAHLTAPHLEARLMRSLDAAHVADGPTSAVRLKGHTTTYAASLAAAIAAVVFVSIWPSRHPEPIEHALHETPRIESAAPNAPVSSVAPLAPVVEIAPSARVAPSARGPAHSAPGNPSAASAISAPSPFLPLMPMTEEELDGPFQLIRVQMPRASLGALRSPLDPPDELVQADVLLGEDGMARAIRVSSGAAIQPWRSR